MKALMVAAAAAFMLAGCASGYKEFYRPMRDVTPESIAASRAAPPSGSPIVERVPRVDPKELLDSYMKRGYGLIGTSAFTSGQRVSDQAAIAQANEVGADLVAIIDPAYAGTVTTSVPISTPTSSTTYYSGTATAYGNGGPVTAYGSGAATTYGTTTTMMPVSVDRTEYAAWYLVKIKYRLGVYVRELNQAERAELQSNKGAVIRVVVDGTPAFDADLLPGDIIVEMDGQEITSPEKFGIVSRTRTKDAIDVSLIRRGQRIKKTVQIKA